MTVTPELERVAAALRPFFSGADLVDGEHYNAARAALLAIREPTDVQLQVMLRTLQDEGATNLSITAAWEARSAMIDHILSDPSTQET